MKKKPRSVKSIPGTSGRRLPYPRLVPLELYTVFSRVGTPHTSTRHLPPGQPRVNCMLTRTMHMCSNTPKTPHLHTRPKVFSFKPHVPPVPHYLFTPRQPRSRAHNACQHPRGNPPSTRRRHFPEPSHTSIRTKHATDG